MVQPQGLGTVGAVNTPRLGSGLGGAVGMGIQSTLGHLAGNQREEGPNFRLFLSLSLLGVAP